MAELIRLYVRLAWLRCGPQDVPASPILLAITLAAYVFVNLLFGGLLLQSQDVWWQMTLADAALTFVWYFALMRLAGKPERFLQTAIAVFGYQVVLTPLFLGAVWLLKNFGVDPTWQLFVQILYISLLMWIVTVNVRIVKAALEWGTLSAAMIVVLQMIFAHLLFGFLWSP